MNELLYYKVSLDPFTSVGLVSIINSAGKKTNIRCTKKNVQQSETVFWVITMLFLFVLLILVLITPFSKFVIQ